MQEDKRIFADPVMSSTHSIARVDVLTTSHASQWDSLLNELPVEFRDINFTSGYHRMFERNGDGQTTLFVYRSAEKLFLYPFLLRTIENAGRDLNDIETVYGYTGPLSNCDDPEFIEAAKNGFDEFCRKNNVVTEFIRFNPLLENQRIASKDSIQIIPLRDYVVVNTEQSPEEIFKSYTSVNRNMIRKAEKSGIRIVTDPSRKMFDRFVDIYIERMKEISAMKMYFFSPAFFEELYSFFTVNGRLFSAIHNDKIIGGSIFIGNNKNGYYFLSAVEQEGRTMATGNLLLHHGILWAQENGMHRVHLGGGLTGDAKDPLLQFKKNFSPETEKFYIGKRIHNPGIYNRLIQNWDHTFAPAADRYKHMLQRYRLKKEDISDATG